MKKSFSIPLVVCLVIASVSGLGIYFSQKDQTPPILKNLGVEFANYNSETHMAGAFNFTDELGSTIFLEFGKVILGEGGLPKTLPTFEYYVNKSAQVIAICDGVVQSVNFQPDRGDYEINFVPQTGSIRESAWMINQDHILGVNVHAGDHISAGQVLGTAGECWVAGIGRTEIMIYNRDTGKAFAPFALFDPSSITEYEAKVTTLMSDWETFKGDSSIFDEDKMVYPGCYNVSLP